MVNIALQYNIPIGSIANTLPVLVQYCILFYIFIIGIGIASAYIGYRYCQLVHQYQYSSNFPHG